MYAGTVYSSSFFVVRESSTKIANRSEFVSSLVGPSRWIRVCLCVFVVSSEILSCLLCARRYDKIIRQSGNGHVVGPLMST